MLNYQRVTSCSLISLIKNHRGVIRQPRLWPPWTLQNCQNWWVPKSWGYPCIAGWFITENPKQKWMITRGTPHSRNPPHVYHPFHVVTHMRTMVLASLPTYLPQKWPSFVGKYSSTMVRIWVRLKTHPISSTCDFRWPLNRPRDLCRCAPLFHGGRRDVWGPPGRGARARPAIHRPFTGHSPPLVMSK